MPREWTTFEVCCDECRGRGACGHYRCDYCEGDGHVLINVVMVDDVRDCRVVWLKAQDKALHAQFCAELDAYNAEYEAHDSAHFGVLAVAS